MEAQMEKIELQNAGTPGDEIAGVALNLATSQNAAPESLPSSDRASFPSMGAMPRSCYAVMAVVNEDGYLVPVCTAADLLRVCKIIWQASAE
jgi:hypothetical protein